MTRPIVVLLGALALAGCATSKERVTLLDPVETPFAEGSTMGSLVVEHGGGGETVIDMANQQALLRGDKPPRIRQLEGRDASHTEVMSALPLPIASRSFAFASSEEELSPTELGRLKEFLQSYIVSFCVYYRELDEGQCADYDALPPAEVPPFQVVIAGFTDSYGKPETSDEDLARFNQEISINRALNVKKQVEELVRNAGIPIRDQDIETEGQSHFAALKAHNGERVSDDAFRIVTVTVR